MLPCNVPPTREDGKGPDLGNNFLLVGREHYISFPLNLLLLLMRLNPSNSDPLIARILLVVETHRFPFRTEEGRHVKKAWLQECGLSANTQFLLEN